MSISTSRAFILLRVRRSAPKPSFERQSRFSVCSTPCGRGEPCKLAAGAIERPRRAATHTAKPSRFCFLADPLTLWVGHERPAGVQGIGSRQPHFGNAYSRVNVRNPLVSGQGRADEKRTGVIAKVLRLVRPRGDEQAKIVARRYDVFIQVQRGKTVRRVPSAAPLSREVGVERVAPPRIANPPPLVSAW